MASTSSAAMPGLRMRLTVGSVSHRRRRGPDHGADVEAGEDLVEDLEGQRRE
uniref:Uncharacterized protein n=1 Tax=Arundo donax TaxID=35708 RepID=A0A0A9AJB0_ARUDO